MHRTGSWSRTKALATTFIFRCRKVGYLVTGTLNRIASSWVKLKSINHSIIQCAGAFNFARNWVSASSRQGNYAHSCRPLFQASSIYGNNSPSAYCWTHGPKIQRLCCLSCSWRRLHGILTHPCPLLTAVSIRAVRWHVLIKEGILDGQDM